MRSALALALLLVCSFSIEAYAHGGRTNSAGCHNNRKTGGYHCHGKKSKSSSSYKKSYKTPSKTYNSPSKPYKNSSPSYNYQQPAAPKSKNTAYDNQVFQAQTMLNELGYNAGKPDGIYGPKTRKAIEKFQGDYGFTTTGKVTPLLIRQLKLRISKLNRTVES